MTTSAITALAVRKTFEFATPGPIAATVEVAGAEVRVTASDRTDTVVLVEPIDEANRSDVKVADRTKVEFADGRLSIKRPVSGSKNGSVAITIDLPTGSNLATYLAYSAVHADGSFGECELHMASGQVQLDHIDALQARIASGQVTIGHVAGRADIDGGAIAMRIGEVEGTVGFSTSGGQVWIDHACADLDLSSSCDFDIDRADGSVTATQAGGAIRIGRMTHGRAKLINGSGTSRSASARAPLPRSTSTAIAGRCTTSSRREMPARRTTRSWSTPARGTVTSSSNAQRADPQEASVTSTSSDQLACVPSRITSANRASPR